MGSTWRSKTKKKRDPKLDRVLEGSAGSKRALLEVQEAEMGGPMETRKQIIKNTGLNRYTHKHPQESQSDRPQLRLCRSEPYYVSESRQLRLTYFPSASLHHCRRRRSPIVGAAEEMSASVRTPCRRRCCRRALAATALAVVGVLLAVVGLVCPAPAWIHSRFTRDSVEI